MGSRHAPHADHRPGQRRQGGRRPRAPPCGARARPGAGRADDGRRDALRPRARRRGARVRRRGHDVPVPDARPRPGRRDSRPAAGAARPRAGGARRGRRRRVAGAGARRRAGPGFAEALGDLFAELQRSLASPGRFAAAVRAWREGAPAHAGELAALYSAYHARLEALEAVDADGLTHLALNAAREAWDGRPLFLYGFDELLPDPAGLRGVARPPHRHRADGRGDVRARPRRAGRQRHHGRAAQAAGARAPHAGAAERALRAERPQRAAPPGARAVRAGGPPRPAQRRRAPARSGRRARRGRARRRVRCWSCCATAWPRRTSPCWCAAAPASRALRPGLRRPTASRSPTSAARRSRTPASAPGCSPSPAPPSPAARAQDVVTGCARRPARRCSRPRAVEARSAAAEAGTCRPTPRSGSSARRPWPAELDEPDAAARRPGDAADAGASPTGSRPRSATGANAAEARRCGSAAAASAGSPARPRPRAPRRSSTCCRRGRGDLDRAARPPARTCSARGRDGRPRGPRAAPRGGELTRLAGDDPRCVGARRVAGRARRGRGARRRRRCRGRAGRPARGPAEHPRAPVPRGLRVRAAGGRAAAAAAAGAVPGRRRPARARDGLRARAAAPRGHAARASGRCSTRASRGPRRRCSSRFRTLGRGGRAAAAVAVPGRRARAVHGRAVGRGRGRRLLAEVTWPPAEAPTPHELRRAQRRGRASGRRPPPLGRARRRQPVLALLAARDRESARGLETFAGCPVKWLIEHVLRPAPVDPDPEPMRRGSLGHAVLERTLRRLKARTGSARARAGDARRALDELHAAIGELIARPRARCPRRAAARALEVDLERYIRHEARPAPGYEPVQLEWSFDDEGALHARRRRGQRPRGPRRHARRPRDRPRLQGPDRPRRARAGREDGKIQAALYALAVREQLGRRGRRRALPADRHAPTSARAASSATTSRAATSTATSATARSSTRAWRSPARSPPRPPPTCARAASRPAPTAARYNGGCAHPGICALMRPNFTARAARRDRGPHRLQPARRQRRLGQDRRDGRADRRGHRARTASRSTRSSP